MRVLLPITDKEVVVTSVNVDRPNKFVRVGYRYPTDAPSGAIFNALALNSTITVVARPPSTKKAPFKRRLTRFDAGSVSRVVRRALPAGAQIEVRFMNAAVNVVVPPHDARAVKEALEGNGYLVQTFVGSKPLYIRFDVTHRWMN